MQRFSAGGLVLVGLALTFAVFDWVMSLDAVWVSNILGIYVFAGGFAAALGGLAAAVAVGQQRSLLPAGVGPDHLHAVGRLLFAFVIFWTYIAFVQFLLMWIADLPEEVRWISDRSAGGWEAFAVALTAAHFVIPFFGLISRESKRKGVVLASIAVCVLVAHYLDIYFLVLPEFYPRRLQPHWLDAAALIAVVGSVLAAVGFRARGLASHPVGDPLLGESLSYESA